MSEPTITDWIGAVASAATALIVLVGLIIAWKQLNAWRVEARLPRKSEIAEELIALVYGVEDALKEIRSPFDSVPKEKANDKQYAYQRRYDRITKNNDLFRKLREMQIRARAVIGNKIADNAVEELFGVRSEIAVAIEILSDYAGEGQLQPEDRDHQKKLRSTVYGSFSKTDLVGNKITASLESDVEQLSPVARFETK